MQNKQTNKRMQRREESCKIRVENNNIPKQEEKQMQSKFQDKLQLWNRCYGNSNTEK